MKNENFCSKKNRLGVLRSTRKSESKGNVRINPQKIIFNLKMSDNTLHNLN